MIDQRSFPQVPESVPRARRFVAEMIAGISDAVTERTAVMVSELATNAIRHAATPFAVRVEVTPTEVCLEVTDSGPGEPGLRAPAPRAPSGRGLRIVDALSDDWGVRPDPSGRGKTVWFSVSLPAGVVLAHRQRTMKLKSSGKDSMVAP